MKGDHKPTPYPSGSKQQAENSNGHFSIKNFFKALRNASNAYKLVWAASKQNALFNFALTPIAALMPAAQAWVGKLIVEAGAKSAKDLGSVMKLATLRLKGRAEGKAISDEVKGQLSKL